MLLGTGQKQVGECRVLPGRVALRRKQSFLPRMCLDMRGNDFARISFRY